MKLLHALIAISSVVLAPSLSADVLPDPEPFDGACFCTLPCGAVFKDAQAATLATTNGTYYVFFQADDKSGIQMPSSEADARCEATASRRRGVPSLSLDTTFRDATVRLCKLGGPTMAACAKPDECVATEVYCASAFGHRLPFKEEPK